MDIMWQWKRRKFLASGVPALWGSDTMRHSFHHPALTTCGAPLPPGKRYVAIRYLTKDLIFFVVDVQGKGQEIFEDACKYLGLQDTELFGLAFIQDEEYIFIDPSLKVSKYAVRSWKTTDFGIGSDGQPLLVLYLRVKHYVDCHLLISEKVARHHYYVQLRENVKNYSQPMCEEKSFVLAALALQADLGNYSFPRHKDRYFEIAQYFPPWVILKFGENYIIKNVPALHKDHSGLSRGEAQVAYIKEASDKTAPHNLHFYKMQWKKGKAWNGVWLGIGDSGLHIYEQLTGKTKRLLSTFLWCDIAKLHFERKKFEIVCEGSPQCRKFTYYVSNEELAKNLLWMCQSTHHFHMSNEVRVQDLTKLELDGGKSYRESYIYTDQSDLEQHEKQNCSLEKTIHCHATDSNGDKVNCMNEVSTFQPSLKFKAKSSQNIHRINSNAETYSHMALKNRSLETLPLSNGYELSPDGKYKSQSIACFPDRLFSTCTIFPEENSHWNPAKCHCLSATPVSTLSSQRSCTSCSNSACSSLSLASGSTAKASNLNIYSKKQSDNARWLKCNSFEELANGYKTVETKSLPHKVCISTFRDNHVRTASFYDAIGVTARGNPLSSSRKALSCALPSTSQSSPKSSKITTISQVHQESDGVTSQSQKTSKSDVHYRPRHARHSDAHTCRTATRIGISSLSRDQRLPLTLFNGKGQMAVCGSEPNLHNSLFDCDGNKLAGFRMLRDSVQNRLANSKKPNSSSEMCLTGIGQNRSDASVPCSNRVNNSDEMDCGFILEDKVDESEEFPFIPPPPAYRNTEEGAQSSELSVSDVNEITVNGSQDHILERESEQQSSSIPSTTDFLDIQQLRQRSQDLDLPLISALCNDRSLLMLPKTVPTCSRQRHLGNKDHLRFARGYSTTPSSDTSDSVSTAGRPATWHVESHASPSWLGDLHKNNLFYNRPNVTESNRQNLPPTILTSFGKAADKCNSSSDSSSYKSSDYRLNKLQMIPTKLLSDIVSNGKIHLKGSSS